MSKKRKSAQSKTVPQGAFNKGTASNKRWKEPIFGAKEAIGGKLPLSWRFSHGDKGGPFSWSAVTAQEMFGIMRKIPEFEVKTWDELHAARCHPIAAGLLEKSARDRLVEIEHDDQDELMSFHLSGENRIWCIQDGNFMRILWWDPNHQVYITEVDRADRQKRHRRSR